MKQGLAQHLLDRVVRVLPPRQAYGMATTLSGLFLRKKSARLLDDTRALFPDRSDAWVRATVSRQRHHRAWVAVDKYLFPRLTGEQFVAMHAAEDVARLRRLVDDALAAGKGAIVYTLHYGRPASPPLLLPELGYPCLVMVRSVGGEGLRDQHADAVERRGGQFVAADDLSSGVEAMRGLTQNKLLFVLIDGRRTQRSTMVEFLGRRVPFSLGFARLARRTGARLIASATYTGAGPAELRIDARPVELPGEEVSPEALGRHLVAPLEEIVARDVGQWYGVNRSMREARGRDDEATEG